MLRTISKTITVATVAETLADIIVGGAGYRRTIVGIYFETIANVHARVYLNNDRILEVSGDIITDAVQPIPIDHELADGDTISAGFYNGTGGSVTHDLSVVVREEPAN